MVRNGQQLSGQRNHKGRRWVFRRNQRLVKMDDIHHRLAEWLGASGWCGLCDHYVALNPEEREKNDCCGGYC
jgi:hypothetical protein